MANQIQSCFERYEKKYMLTPAQLRVMLTGMKAHMVPDQYGKYAICNIYYDTPDWRHVRRSPRRRPASPGPGHAPVRRAPERPSQ